MQSKVVFIQVFFFLLLITYKGTLLYIEGGEKIIHNYYFHPQNTSMVSSILNLNFDANEVKECVSLLTSDESEQL